MNIDQNAMCCISMNLSQRASQSNKKLYFKFQISFRNFDRKPKNIQTNRELGVNIDKSEMCYISMDFTRQGLQTNGKLF